MNAIQMFELILNYGTKTTTYKFGLLTSITDYIIENPLESPVNNFHFIPVYYLAKQFLAYYFPLAVDNIRQGPKIKEKSSAKIVADIVDFQDLAETNNLLPISISTSEDINLLISYIEDDEQLPNELKNLLFDIRKKILDQPIRHIRKVKGDKVSFFGLLSNEISFQSSFDEHLEIGLSLKKEKIKEISKWDELLETENCYLFFGHQTYQEISELRFWLRDVIIKRWAQECIERFAAKAPDLLSKFDYWKKLPERDSNLIKKYKDFYITNKLNHCLYCQKELNRNNIRLDHFLPWSRFPVNRFWNLYPACSSCNSVKLDRIPSINDNLTMKIGNHLEVCLENIKLNELIKNDLENLYKKRFKSELIPISKHQIIEEIIEYIKIHITNFTEIIPGYQYPKE